MTALNVLRQSKAVHIVTDGGRWYGDGSSGPPGAKTWPLPHLNAIFAARGPALLGAGIVLDFINTAGASYDEMKINIAGRVRAACNEFRARWTGPDTAIGLEIVVAGWSESKGADSFIMTNHSDRGTPPFTIEDIREVLILPATQSILTEFEAGMPAGIASVDDLDAEREAVRILEIQRQEKMPVGAFAQITTVTRECITTKILRRWPEQGPARQS
jgi:hypothetical protein